MIVDSFPGRRLRHDLDSGRKLVVALQAIPDPRFVDVLGRLGFDGVVIDAEHDGMGLRDIYEGCRAAEASGIYPLVRIPDLTLPWIQRAADAGAAAVIAPHIRTPELAKVLVQGTWYPPHGIRGMSTGSRAAGFGIRADYTSIVEQTDLRPVSIAMIEDAEALDILDDILDVPGFEVGWVGMGDLAASLGLPAQLAHPRVQEATRRAMDALSGSGKHAMIVAADAEQAIGLLHAGASIAVMSPVKMLATVAQAALTTIRTAVPEMVPTHRWEWTR